MLTARGATDDKGQVFSIIKAFEAVLADGPPPVNVRFLIEGQEETGSEILFGLLAREPERVKADAVLVAAKVDVSGLADLALSHFAAARRHSATSEQSGVT